MQRYLRWFFVAIMLCVSGAFMSAPAANAASNDTCSAKVVDQTKGHVLNVSKVQSAVTKLDNEHGTDTYVRAFQSAPSGSLDAYWASQVRACQNWALDGKPKGNVVLVVFSMDHKSAIFYGSNFHEELDHKVDGIRSDMGDDFRAGNFTAGVATALDGIDHAMTPFKMPGWVGKAVLVLFVLVALILIGFILVRIGRSARKRKAKLAAAKTAAIKARDFASDPVTAVIGSSETRDITSLLEIARSGLNNETRRQLDELWNKVQVSTQAVVNCMGKLEGPAYDPDRPQTLERYEEIKDGYNEVLEFANSAKSELDAVENRCNEVIERINNINPLREQLEGESTRLKNLRSALVAEGFKVPFDDQTSQLDQLLREVVRQTELKQPGQALDELDAAEKLAAKIGQRLAKLRTDRDKITKRCDELTGNLSKVDRLVEGAKVVLGNLQQRFGDECVQDIMADVSRADASAARAREELDRAGKSASMRRQDWDNAQDALNQTARLSNESIRSCEAIAARRESLERLAQSLVADVDQLINQIDRADSQMRGYRGSNRARRQSLAKIRTAMVDLQGQLNAGSQPNYLTIGAAYDSAKGRVTKLQRAAKSEHDQIVADERRREREEREAEDRRRRNSYGNSGYGGSFAGGAAGGYFGSTYGNSSSSSSDSSFGGGSSDFGGGSSGNWSGDSGGGSSGGW